MSHRTQTLAALIGVVVISLALAGCGGSEDRRVVTSSEAAFVPVIESSDIFVGVPRLVLTLLERDAQPEFADGASFLIRYFEPTEGGIKFHSEAELLEINVDGLRYLIADQPPFAIPGQWAIAITVELPDDTAESTPRLPFIVRGVPTGLTVGDAAPSVKTPTASDGVLERMAEVPDEARGMYEHSAVSLLESGTPFLIVWASAERCAGRIACALALEQATDIFQRGRHRGDPRRALRSAAQRRAAGVDRRRKRGLVDRGGAAVLRRRRRRRDCRPLRDRGAAVGVGRGRRSSASLAAVQTPSDPRPPRQDERWANRPQCHLRNSVPLQSRYTQHICSAKGE